MIHWPAEIWLKALVAIQMIGSLFALLVFIRYTESVMVSSPILTTTGMLIAVMSFRRGLARGLFVGLAVPTFSIFCFVLIYGCQWGPGHAHVPILCLMIPFIILLIPASIATFQEFDQSPFPESKSSAQYGIGALMILIGIVALIFAAVRIGKPPLTGFTILFCYLAVIGYQLHTFAESKEGNLFDILFSQEGDANGQHANGLGDQDKKS